MPRAWSTFHAWWRSRTKPSKTCSRRHLPGGYASYVVTQKVGLPCVHVESDFKGPLRFGDEVEVSMIVAGFGTSSVAFDVEVTRGDSNPCAKMRYIVACADLSDSPKKRSLPADLKAALARHLR